MQISISQALIPQRLIKFENKVVAETIAFVAGVSLISLLAQVAITLPWTPVPITGQTFGVALVALSWGRQRAISIMLGYLSFGALGLPIFALGKSGLSIGPTLGYLVGMLLSSYVVGALSDNGYTTSLKKSLIAAFSGSVIIFSCGLIGLSFFVPGRLLIASGLLPFIPGDIIKNIIAASVSWKMRTK